MAVPAPPIDPRTVEQLVAQTESLLQRYSDWRPASAGGDNSTATSDPGQALVRIFARLAELVIDRLNQAPEKNFLAFLDLVGLALLPPQAARVPLTFRLAAGSTTDALAPARLQVAATPLEGETEPVIFETERELVITRSQLVAAFTHEPGRDRYSDHTAGASGQSAAPFAPFQGEQPIAHHLYLGRQVLYDLPVEKTIEIEISPADPAQPWLNAMTWAYQTATGWVNAPAEVVLDAAAQRWRVTLPMIPAVTPQVVGAQGQQWTSAWLRGRLSTATPRGAVSEDTAGGVQLQQTGLMPDAGFAEGVPLAFDQPFYPFGQSEPRTTFYLACDDAFGKPGAAVTLTLALDPVQPAQPTPDLILSWSYWDGAAWQEVGRSSPAAATLGGATTLRDETHALTHSGVVTFPAPGRWATQMVNERSQHWLRVQIVAGRYVTTTRYQPPVVQRLTVAYQWPLPLLDAIRTRIAIARTDRLPELLFLNQLALDPTKDFLPFGEKPRFNDTFYLASEALAQPDAAITLLVKLTNPGDEKATPLPAKPAETLTVRWEFWDGALNQWALLGETGPGAQQPPAPGFQDETAAFTKEGRITFRCPPTLRQTLVNGQPGWWVRVRLVKGDYGVDARYTPVVGENGQIVTDRTTGAPIYQLTPATFRPPSIQQLRWAYTYESPWAPLDYTLAENDFTIVDHSRAIAAGQKVTPFVPMTDAQPTFYLGFDRPGATTGFANRATTLYCAVADIFYSVGRGLRKADAEPPTVVWEYWNGSQWARLGALDETQGFTRRGLVTFIGPADFRTSFAFGRLAFWLRARWERGTYATPPHLARLLTNTIWASHTLTIANEILGSSNGERDQLFRLTKAPVLPGQRIEVREAELPSATERAILAAEEGDDAITKVLDASGRPTEIWVRWHEVPDFYGSTPRSRHYMIDRLRGEVRFGNGRAGLAPPRGRTNLRATYQAGGGPNGNRPVATVTQLKSAVPYVDGVTNLEPVRGGAAAETLADVKNRGPKTLRHRDRAVAIADFEDLALQASTDVARAKGFPAHNSQDAGSVMLVIVPRLAGAQPIPSLELLGRVQAYLQARVSPLVALWVSGPAWLAVNVTAEVAPVTLDAAAAVQTAILARLAAFLHPLTGGLDGAGWDFGRRPYRSDLYALIESTPGVDHVRRLIVTTVGDSEPTAHFLVYSGTHQIIMSGGSEIG